MRTLRVLLVGTETILDAQTRTNPVLDTRKHRIVLPTSTVRRLQELPQLWRNQDPTATEQRLHAYWSTCASNAVLAAQPSADGEESAQLTARST
jgi:hypothetical protein